MIGDDFPEAPWTPHVGPVGSLERSHTGDPVNLADFEVGAREAVCSSCWLVHRTDVECA